MPNKPIEASGNWLLSNQRLSVSAFPCLLLKHWVAIVGTAVLTFVVRTISRTGRFWCCGATANLKEN